jgi:hypothetical protein
MHRTFSHILCCRARVCLPLDPSASNSPRRARSRYRRAMGQRSVRGKRSQEGRSARSIGRDAFGRHARSRGGMIRPLRLPDMGSVIYSRCSEGCWATDGREESWIKGAIVS